MPANKASCRLAGTYNVTGRQAVSKQTSGAPGGHTQRLPVKVTGTYDGEEV